MKSSKIDHVVLRIRVRNFWVFYKDYSYKVRDCDAYIIKDGMLHFTTLEDRSFGINLKEITCYRSTTILKEN